ncbi:esterase-like activity of phytase-domain-containing protein [Tricladium varicosporioides]|nr:esterase-like activity of phytase-domain-containing protein [Hymenoscyphus varicosporioides]
MTKGLSRKAYFSGFDVSQTSCGKKNYAYTEIAGATTLPSDGRDQFGDTLGGLSGIAIDRSQWKKLADGSYTSVMWALSDRGWTPMGTNFHMSRIHQYSIKFIPQPGATAENPVASNNIQVSYINTVLLWGPDGTTPTTGFDADATGHVSFPDLPDLPVATFPYEVPPFPAGTKGIALDAQGLTLGVDGTFWISDNYGPYIYHFDTAGTMLSATRPPNAFIPTRNNSDSFSSDSPPIIPGVGISAAHDVFPNNNPTGRHNNQGFKGLTLTRDGKSLFVMLEAALNQEGGLSQESRRYARLLEYDISNSKKTPHHVKEFVVPLPLYTDLATGKVIPATQTEIMHIKDGQFFILARDSGAGFGKARSESVYRHIDIFDIDEATDIKSPNNDCTTCSIASGAGKLKNSIKPTTYCPFLDFNNNSQLNRFSLHNGGGVFSTGLLPEKWDSMAMVPVDGKKGDDDQWFIFTASNNGDITQNGFYDFGESTYKDPSGLDESTMLLTFKVALPAHSNSA